MEPLTMGLIMAGSSLVGSTINGLFQSYGLKKQAEENRRAEKLTLQVEKEKGERSDRQFEQTMAFNKKQFKDQKKQASWDKFQGFLNNYLSQMNQNPQLTSNLINIQRARRV